MNKVFYLFPVLFFISACDTTSDTSDRFVLKGIVIVIIAIIGVVVRQIFKRKLKKRFIPDNNKSSNFEKSSNDEEIQTSIDHLFKILIGKNSVNSEKLIFRISIGSIIGIPLVLILLVSSIMKAILISILLLVCLGFIFYFLNQFFFVKEFVFYLNVQNGGLKILNSEKIILLHLTPQDIHSIEFILEKKGPAEYKKLVKIKMSKDHSKSEGLWVNDEENKKFYRFEWVELLCNEDSLMGEDKSTLGDVLLEFGSRNNVRCINNY